MTSTGYIVLLSVVSSEKHEHPKVFDDPSWNVSRSYEIPLYVCKDGSVTHQSVLVLNG